MVVVCVRIKSNDVVSARNLPRAEGGRLERKAQLPNSHELSALLTHKLKTTNRRCCWSMPREVVAIEGLLRPRPPFTDFQGLQLPALETSPGGIVKLASPKSFITIGRACLSAGLYFALPLTGYGIICDVDLLHHQR